MPEFHTVDKSAKGGDAIVEVIDGVPFLVNRPEGCPRIVIRCYAVSTLVPDFKGKPWCQWRTDDKGNKYVEATWG